MRSGARRSTIGCSAAFLASIGVACSNQLALPPLGGDCTHCAVSTTGGGQREGGTVDRPDAANEGESSADATSVGQPSSVTVSFDVGQTNDTRFIDVMPYSGPVRVSALDVNGTVVSTGDAGVGSGGTIDGVASGSNWFAVEDSSSSRNILATLQPVLVDESAPALGLVAITAKQLAPLMVDRDQPWTPLPGRATLILIFNHGGKLISGITMNKDLPTGANVAYEQAGAYVTPMANPDVNTDDEGTLIVRDIEGMASYPATTSVKLSYQLGTSTLTFDTRLAADFVTWMTVAVP